MILSKQEKASQLKRDAEQQRYEEEMVRKYNQH